MANYRELLEQKREKADKLQKQIKLLEAKANHAARKERTGKLVAWGITVEQLLAQGEISPEGWTQECQRLLSGRTLERALVQELVPMDGKLENPLTL